MAKFPGRDLTGQRFGRLTAIYPIKIKKSRTRWYWHCVCDCGNEKDIESSVLICGKARSCGCLRRQTSAQKFKDLKGKTFGRLTVIKRSILQSDKSGRSLWDCKCTCGKTVIVPSNSLLSGLTQSCGCLQIETVTKLRPEIDARHTIDGVIVPGLKRKLYSNNKTGYKGIYKINHNDNNDYYVAGIGYRKKWITIGTFSKLSDAIDARKKAEDKYYKPILDKDRKNN